MTDEPPFQKDEHVLFGDDAGTVIVVLRTTLAPSGWLIEAEIEGHRTGLRDASQFRKVH